MKVFLVYDVPFWRKRGLSGHSISDTGIVDVFHDASPHDGSCGVLFGFIGNQSPARHMKADERKQAIITQVKRTYGWQARDMTHYHEVNWAYDPFTTRSGDSISDSDAHPAYGHAQLQEPIMSGRLFWGSSEVSTVSGGYLDGAVYRANELADMLISLTTN